MTPAEPLRDPVARVVVDVPHPHLDRPFDYAVPAALSGTAIPGVRVRVRFSGRLVDGYVLERAATSEHVGQLAPLVKVVSAEPVLAPEVARLARSVADRYAGTLPDVLRLAVPPRHARVEGQASVPVTSPPRPFAGAGPWERYDGGAAFVAALRSGGSPRAVWSALPAPAPEPAPGPGPPTARSASAGWPHEIAVAAAATLGSGRGSLVVVPDARDVDRLDTALDEVLGAGHHVVLRADLGPAERYRRWLRVRRGAVKVVVGTRSAVFAPVHDLGLVAVWDDGDDLHAEPRAPYPHAREVLVQRAFEQGCAALVGGFAVTAEGAALLASGWAHPLRAARSVVRAATPTVVVAADDAALERDPLAASAHLPHLAWQVARDALARGPVLVQVPRGGYLPALACQRCRAPARCAACHGPLALSSGHAVASCRWCARVAGGWHCEVCGSGGLRSRQQGVRRTAEELGRAFPGTPVRASTGEDVLATVPPAPSLVVATPGAEPVADGEYAAVLLLDGDTLLARADLRAGEEALRRWLGAAALCRPASAGGRVVVAAEPSAVATQALVRWDPGGFAERELADRVALRFPPAARVATVTGAPDAVADLLACLRLPDGAEVLGPARAEDPTSVRAVVRADRAQGRELSRALHAAQALRSARKAAEPVRVCVDPAELG